MPDLKTINEVFAVVRSKMVYASDSTVFGKTEYWKSWKDEIVQGKKPIIRDDCDGFALTMAELLLEKGFKPEDVAICFCAIHQNGSKDLEYHLVCKVRNPEDNEWYVMDNNVPKPQKRDRSGGPDWSFKWISCMYVDKPGEWVEDI